MASSVTSMAPVPVYLNPKEAPPKCCLAKIKELAIRIFNWFKKMFQTLGKKFRAMCPRTKSRLEDLPPPKSPQKRPTTTPVSTQFDRRADYIMQIPGDPEERMAEVKIFLYKEAGLASPDKIPTDHRMDIARQKLQKDGMELQYLTKEEQDIDELVQIAVNNNWRARPFSSERLQRAESDHLFSPKAQAIAQVQRNGMLLGTKELEPFIDDEDVVTEAVKQSSDALEFASSRWQNVKMRKIAHTK